jgi:hypothetical protein
LATGGTGFSWFLGNFAEISAAAIAWLAAHAVYLHRGPLVHLLLTYPSGRSTSRLTRGAIAVGYAAAIITPIWRNEAATIILAVALLLVCLYDYVRSIGWLRRARRIALQAAIGLSLVLAGTAAARMVLPAGDASVLSLVLYEMTLCLIAGGLLVGLLAAPWQRVLIADLVVELGEARSDTLRGGQRTRAQIARAEDQLRHALEDLSRLATGLHPRVLAEHGLQEGLVDIARDVGVPVDLKVTHSTAAAHCGGHLFHLRGSAHQ